ncbi:MAG: TRAM domain-containing protein [Actinomycetota bacterium]|nr:TRAM domain-containing protein [Actinomycetota bacterium]
MSRLELSIDRLANGGDGVARDPDGRVVFVPGGLPGDLVDVVIEREAKRFARARLVGVPRAGPGRIEPPCPEVAAGCGGCDLQHAAPDALRTWKRTIVADALARIGGLRDVTADDVDPGPDLATSGFRTTLRLGVRDGRAGYRRRRSHDVLTVGGCLIAHPGLEELIRDGRYGSSTEVVLRVSASTGRRMVVATPTAEGVTVPDDVLVVGDDELDAGRAAHLTDRAGGRDWRISARSFFQTRADGADALVATVRGHLRHLLRDSVDGATVVDAYCGVGLLSAAAAGARIIGVERSPDAAADAAHNLGVALRTAGDASPRAGADTTTVLQMPFEEWEPEPADAVIADPSRAGLGAAGVDRVVGTGARAVTLVSCDAGSLGRDARLLTDAGYALVGTTLVDLFPHTAHTEVVTSFADRNIRGRGLHRTTR